MKTLLLTTALALINQGRAPAVIKDPIALEIVFDKLESTLVAASNDPIARLNLPIQLELERTVPIKTAALLRGCSPDSITRHYGKFITRVGNKVRGIKLKYLFDLTDEPMPPLPPTRAKRRPPQVRKRRFGQGAKQTAATTEMPEGP
jgi:hypothetical protein